MLIVNPSVELLNYYGNTIEHVCRCARVCYDKESGNDEKLYKSLLSNHHWSVFRHASYYVMTRNSWNFPYFIYDLCGSKQKVAGIDIKKDKTCYYIVYNGNWALDYPEYHKLLSPHLISPEEFANTEVGHSMMRYTFLVSTQISTSREINRASPNNITELSTRYVDLKNGAICRPHWMTAEEAENWNDGLVDNLSIRTESYCRSCDSAFNTYRTLIKTFDFKREDARGVLPLDTATKAIYTYSIKEWKNIIDLRTGKGAHPNCKIIANMIKRELEELGYDFN